MQLKLMSQKPEAPEGFDPRENDQPVQGAHGEPLGEADQQGGTKDAEKPGAFGAPGARGSQEGSPHHRQAGMTSQQGGKTPQMPRPVFSRKSLLIILIIATLVCVVVYQVNQGRLQQNEIPTSEFISAVEEGRVAEVTYHASNHKLDGLYWKEKSQIDNEEALVKFTSTHVGNDALSELMREHSSIKYTVDVRNNEILTNLFMTFVPILLIVGVFVYFMRKTQDMTGRGMKFAKTKGKLAQEDRPQVKFSDVAGVDEAVEEIEEIKEFLVDPARFQRLGAKIPRGVLLVGPPGTGKTLLAKAVAGEAGVPFYPISGSDFVELYVGVGASRVRDLFQQAKENAPAIIFIDEIDAVGRQRGAGLGGGHDEREQTLNQLLVEMDGFEDHEAVILIAATNRPDILDPALLRPGRFDRQVTVDRPDVVGREKILRVHSKDKPLESDVRFAKIAGITTGFTGADLANLMNEAALLTARRDKDRIGMAEITESMERVIAGPERKSRKVTDQEKITVAYHECGHALVGHLLDAADPVHKISIIARGMALGYTLSMPEEDRYLKTKREMLDELAVFLAGRVAEEVCCSDITTGASNDLERSTKMARDMVMRYGFSEELGTQAYGEANHEVFLGRDYGNGQDYSPATAERIDREVNRIMREAHDRAHEIISTHRDQLDLMVEVLLEREMVEGEAAQALLNNEWDAYVQREKELTGEQGKQVMSDEQAREEAREEARRLMALHHEQEAQREKENEGKLKGESKGEPSEC